MVSLSILLADVPAVVAGLAAIIAASTVVGLIAELVEARMSSLKSCAASRSDSTSCAYSL